MFQASTETGGRVSAVMRQFLPAGLVMAAALMLALPASAAGTAGAGAPAAARAFDLGPPKPGPFVVRADFELHDVNAINDVTETFELAGVLTLIWKDPRQAFDPVAAGVDEKVYQGGYQFAEVAPGWYPQVVLVNESGLYQNSGVVLRVKPDGTSTLIETVNAVAKGDFDMRRFPFDRQRLDAVFEVLGFGVDEIVLEAIPGDADTLTRGVKIPQWRILGGRLTSGSRLATHAGSGGVGSALTVSVDVERESFYVRRLITLPLVLIVLLSFSVFWMDRSSLGDRLSVSFMGILTAVAYQIVMSGLLPPISYFTLMHGFLTISFLIMVASVVVNLVAGRLDQLGKAALSDRIDKRSRWAFPLVYFGIIFTMLGVTMLVT
ncbi:hypothetical protein [Emcibacter sp. SYSU 3D8]|uniref:hypothetical protein n=1 Tax=Emcibacter sp. SYSU 3D8 TaxID=3133969 RepID=UPI0031FECD58